MDSDTPSILELWHRTVILSLACGFNTAARTPLFYRRGTHCRKLCANSCTTGGTTFTGL